MKKNISQYTAILFFLITALLQAQSRNENYIINRIFKSPMTEVSGVKSSSDVQENITYYDGLGRPVQTIAIRQGGDDSNIITPIEYDGFGRQEKEYLPFTAANNNYNKIDSQAALNAVQSYYQTDSYENTIYPYSQKKFETSPLNRVLKQAAPGNDWAMDSGHEIKIEYQTNTADEVRLFEVITTWNEASGVYEISFWDNGNYDKNELYKTITYDENTVANPLEEDGSTVEFKNKEGQVVLKRTYESRKKYDTYYVYDEYGNLTYVIPPKAEGAITEDMLNNLCYQYQYDYRNRMVEKKLPGKQWEFIVYNKQNQVVATGPVNSPFQNETASGWFITKYDAFGRSIYTGWVSALVNTQSRHSLQQEQNTFIPVVETKPGSVIIEGITVKGNAAQPKSGLKILTANYYDDYEYAKINYRPYFIGGQQVDYDNYHLTTGIWTRVLTTAAALSGETTYLFYDTKKRKIENLINNYLGGFTRIDHMLDFTGKTLTKFTAHRLDTSKLITEILEKFTFSEQDRLLTHTHKINAEAAQLLSNNHYDAIGRLEQKDVGNTVTDPLQKILYAYNIRGWLTHINDVRTEPGTSIGPDIFAMRLTYNSLYMAKDNAKPLYNGNISGIQWRTITDGGVRRSYDYHYDQLNRLIEAVYHTPRLTDNKNYFGESLGYDKNGNILKLQRKFMAGVSSNPYADNMDDLDYFYKPESNQLTKVTDKSNNPQGFKDDSDGYNDTEDDYQYDDNGNLIKDQNKNITQITYNHLNLPKKITFATGSTIDYIYNATGEKVEKIVTDNGVVTKTNYLTGFQYKNGVLQFFPTPEGYVRNTSTTPGTYTFGYVFNYTDHLGNVRLSYFKNPKTNKLEVLEENNYYPFGLKHQGYNTDNLQPNYKYKYNGKELQDELGLAMYDYGARNYDPALGRWMNIDPLAEKSRRFNPYTYALNNPIYFIDPDGMMAEPPVGFDAEQGQIHKDKDGSWIYNKETTTWVGQDGAADIGNTIELNNVSIKGYKSNYVSSGEYGPDKDFVHAIAFAGIVTAPILGAAGGGAYLLSETTAALSQITFGSAATNMFSNATAQFLANGGNLGEINMVSTISSVVPGVGPAIFGETITWTPNRLIDGKSPTTPDSFNKWTVQAGSAVLANRFGKATDNYLSGSSFGEAMVREYFKGIATVGANSAPSLIKK
ncbi:DUF6443 domain-containing protein [Flavobacterium hungaricum]|uniref:RHS repeat-associated core domain-containing protein n=1 Tax=Flavobacterium hungaricum TaxID=2082725 RepID=A0ABR9TJD2_9FLAO|nr:DUF6443 domain-containing protein [Flavobacterium hungaricum]MBE8725376.1 RHS repeat-associated core domain-containing protein [Flavobacterium hungaricum]